MRLELATTSGDEFRELRVQRNTDDQVERERDPDCSPDIAPRVTPIDPKITGNPLERMRGRASAGCR